MFTKVHAIVTSTLFLLVVAYFVGAYFPAPAKTIGGKVGF